MWHLPECNRFSVYLRVKYKVWHNEVKALVCPSPAGNSGEQCVLLWVWEVNLIRVTSSFSNPSICLCLWNSIYPPLHVIKAHWWPTAESRTRPDPDDAFRNILFWRVLCLSFLLLTHVFISFRGGLCWTGFIRLRWKVQISDISSFVPNVKTASVILTDMYWQRLHMVWITNPCVCVIS